MDIPGIYFTQVLLGRGRLPKLVKFCPQIGTYGSYRGQWEFQELSTIKKRLDNYMNNENNKPIDGNRKELPLQAAACYRCFWQLLWKQLVLATVRYWSRGSPELIGALDVLVHVRIWGQNWVEWIQSWCADFLAQSIFLGSFDSDAIESFLIVARWSMLGRVLCHLAEVQSLEIKWECQI